MSLEVEIPEILGPVFEPRRYKIMYGGRGGGKSVTVAKALLIMGLQRKLRILCTREIQKSLADSVIKMLDDEIGSLGLRGFYEVQKSVIKGRNGTEFVFSGLQSHTVDSLRSFVNIDIVWVEEAHRVSTHSWNVLIPTIRKEGSEIWATLNPDQETDYVYERFILGHDPDAWVCKINWRDNKWFPAVLDTERRKLLDVSPDLHDHVWEGKCRSKAGILFKRSWVRYYDRLPDTLNRYVASDYAGEPDPDRPENEPDYTEHGMWGVDSDFRLYALDWWYGQTSPDEWISQWARLVKLHKPLVAFEERGVILRSINGVINQRMQETGAFVVREGLAPAGSKLERAYGFAALMQAGKVFFPRPESAPWVNRLVDQLCAFHGQGGQFDDAVDVCSLMARGLDEVVRARPPPAEPPDPPKPFTEDWFAARDRADAKDAAAKRSYYR